ncbi:MAG TPA: response regulator transcription factor [Phototrophicaceae bacterium]|jgi:DNA-binding NarL/FixJ family response regulator|nr:response regulator transcription factor [Phototrophicaceae bacterium]
MSSDRIRILIVDDHPVVRSGVIGMLVSQPDLVVVGEAENGMMALRLASELQPDLVLLDLRMPDIDGLTVLQQIKARQPKPRVMILTTFEHRYDVTRAINNGADGYLLKDAPRETLIAAIRQAMAGEQIFPTLPPNGLPEVHPLSQREIEVLRLASDGSSNKEIARTLHISEATVKSHFIHIFTRLGVTDRTAAVTTALSRGIIQLDV